MNKIFPTDRPGRQQGLTLIELMIAMLLGILLLLGITQMFMTNKRIYKEQEYMSRVQENARFAMNILMYDIRMAGYTGCADDLQQVTNHLENYNDAKDLLSFSNVIEGSESGSDWQPSGSTDHVASMVANTDGISIRYLQDTGMNIKDFINQQAATMQLDPTNDLYVGELVGLADCASADVFSITSLTTNSGKTQIGYNTGTNNNGPKNTILPQDTGNKMKMSKQYGPDATIVKFVSTRYIIQQDPDGLPALYRYLYLKDTTGVYTYQGQELIPGVQNMQILFGVDTNNNKDANVYVDAQEVTNNASYDWSNVVSIRIALLFETVDQNNQIERDTQSYDLLGGTGNGGYTVAAANDYRRRRVFTTTIQIRNRSH